MDQNSSEGKERNPISVYNPGIDKKRVLRRREPIWPLKDVSGKISLLTPLCPLGVFHALKKNGP